jgi:3-hydroxyisobutyrate dehydrogenase-like beta-hydroxyacid dehydrogenase
MAATSAKIGFVGLGQMGGNMAARLLAAGYAVCGEEQSREHDQRLMKQGLQWCNTPREVAEAADPSACVDQSQIALNSGSSTRNWLLPSSA